MDHVRRRLDEDGLEELLQPPVMDQEVPHTRASPDEAVEGRPVREPLPHGPRLRRLRRLREAPRHDADGVAGPGQLGRQRLGVPLDPGNAVRRVAVAGQEHLHRGGFPPIGAGLSIRP